MARISPKYKSSQLTTDFIEQAKKGGLKFETYLIGTHAEKILKLIDDGYYFDPNDFLFHALNQYFELAKHRDLCQEIFKRKIQRSEKQIDDGQFVSSEKISADINQVIKDIKTKQRPKPVYWKKDKSVFQADFMDDGYVYDESDDTTELLPDTYDEKLNFISFTFWPDNNGKFDSFLNSGYGENSIERNKEIIIPLVLHSIRGPEILKKDRFLLIRKPKSMDDEFQHMHEVKGIWIYLPETESKSSESRVIIKKIIEHIGEF